MKKDLINRIVLIVSASLLLVSSIFLIILSNIHHGKKYIYEGVKFIHNEETEKNEIVEEKIILEFKKGNKMFITYYEADKEPIYEEYLYKQIEGNYIDVKGVEFSSVNTMYLDAFEMKDVSSWNLDTPADYVLICKTNYILKIVLIILIIISAITFIGEGIYHLIDFIKWKRFLKEQYNNNQIMNTNNETA